MLAFITLLSKILPIYATIVLGYIATRFFKIQSKYIAFIVVYILAPLVILFAVLSIEINIELLFVPIIIFIFSTISATFALNTYNKYWNDASINTLAFTCGSGNTAYFGIPLALIILEPHHVNIYIFITLASTAYEYTVGFFVTAKGVYSTKQSIKRVLKLPLIYAFIVGITLNLNGFSMPPSFEPYFEILKYIYGIMGMMILGMAFKGFDLSTDFDKRYVAIAYSHKFLIWPLFMIVFQLIDRLFFNFYDANIYFLLFLFSIVPMAGNTVTFAVLLNAKPQKASFTVLVSTFLSLFSIPLMLFLYGAIFNS